MTRHQLSTIGPRSSGRGLPRSRAAWPTGRFFSKGLKQERIRPKTAFSEAVYLLYSAASGPSKIDLKSKLA